MASPLTAQLNSIFVTKENLARKEGALFLKTYSPYIINKCLAKHRNTFFYALVLNQYPDIPKEEHYEYLLGSVRQVGRTPFAKMAKALTDPDIELIKRHYAYNETRAKEALKILKPEQIEKIRELYKHEQE